MPGPIIACRRSLGARRESGGVRTATGIAPLSAVIERFRSVTLASLGRGRQVRTTDGAEGIQTRDHAYDYPVQF